MLRWQRQGERFTRYRPMIKAWSDEAWEVLLFGDSCGLTSREDANLAMAPLTQSLSSRPRGRWPPRGRRRHAMAVGALVPPDAARVAARGATVYTNAPKRHREAVFADLCTLLRPHGRSRDRAGSRVPRHRRPHGPRDARALGPEAHAARAVTQPPTRTHEASKILYIGLCKTARILKRSYKFLKTLNIMAMVVSESPKD